LKVNNTIKNNRWKGIVCKCNHDSVETEFPIASCLHCQFEERENSIPSKDFKVNETILDKDGKVIKKQTRTVKEITLVHGSKYDDVIGWTF
jgi:hypothetical protein